MTRKPYSAPNYDDPVEWLAPPTSLHAKPQVGQYSLPTAQGARTVMFTVEVCPDGQSMVVTVRSGGARWSI